MAEGANLALIIRGLVSVLLGIGGIVCLILGARLLFRRPRQMATLTSFEASLGGQSLKFSAGAAGTAVVLSSSLWVLGTIVALPSFTQSPQETRVAATSLVTIPFDGASTSLSSDQQAALDITAAPLTEARAETQFIVRSSAAAGSEEENLAIANRRAEAVRVYLMELGVPQDKITIMSQGEPLPDDHLNQVATLSNAVSVQTVRRGGT